MRYIATNERINQTNVREVPSTNGQGVKVIRGGGGGCLKELVLSLLGQDGLDLKIISLCSTLPMTSSFF